MKTRRAMIIKLFIVSAMLPGCAQLSLFSRDVEKKSNLQAQNPSNTIGFGQEMSDGPVPTAESRANLLVAKAQLARQNGSFSEAISILESVLADDAKHSGACRQYALIKIQQGEFAAAERYFHRAIAIDPQNAKLNNDYGYFCYLDNRWSEAEQFLMSAITLDSALAEAKANLGILYARKGLADEARQYFLAAGCTENEIVSNLDFVQKLSVATPELSLERDVQADLPASEISIIQDVASNRSQEQAVNLQLVGHRF